MSEDRLSDEERAELEALRAEKAKRELNWKIKYTNVEDIIATAWAWHSKHPDGFGDRK